MGDPARGFCEENGKQTKRIDFLSKDGWAGIGYVCRWVTLPEDSMKIMGGKQKE